MIRQSSNRRLCVVRSTSGHILLANSRNEEEAKSLFHAHFRGVSDETSVHWVADNWNGHTQSVGLTVQPPK